MDQQDKKNGAIQGDIRQARQTRAPEGIAANIPGVTETVNAQGNRSFTGRGGVAPGQPKQAAPAAPIRTGVMIPEVGKAASGGSGGGGTPGGGGIMAGVDKVGRRPKPDDVSLAMSVQKPVNMNPNNKPAPGRSPAPARPVAATNPVMTAAKQQAGSSGMGIAAGTPGFSTLNTGANLPPSGTTSLTRMADNQRNIEERGRLGNFIAESKALNAPTNILSGIGDWVGAGTAVPADAVRNSLIEWAGGDPDSVEGGRDRDKNQSFAQLQQQLDTASNTFDSIEKSMKSAVLSGTGAKKVEQLDTEAETPQAGNGAGKQPAGKQDTSKADDTTVTGKATDTDTTATGAATDTDQPNDGIIRSTTPDGRRSFSNVASNPADNTNPITNLSQAVPGKINTMNMSIGQGSTAGARGGRGGGIGDGVGSPAFERALAAGDYETALRSANQNDIGQMTRLGQLQGNIRSQREAALANSPSAQDRARAETLKQRAMDLATRGFSKGAQRVMGISDGLVKTKGNGNPNQKDIQTAQELAAEQATLARQRAESDMAESDATLKRNAVEQQGILQGLFEQMNDPSLNDQQRQSLIQRYQALANDGNAYEGRVVDSYDSMGNKTGQTLYTINQRTGQAQMVQPQQQQSQLQVGAVYTSADGTQAKLAGYDESGNPKWEVVK